MKIETTPNLCPEGHKRRNSYIAAVEKNNIYLEPCEIVRRKSVDFKWNVQKKKLTKNLMNNEFEISSECSLSSKKDCRSLTRTPSSSSRSSSFIPDAELSEIYLPYSREKHYTDNNESKNFTDRNDALNLTKFSSSSLSIKRNDSGYSISTYQSILAPSSNVHSAETLHNLSYNNSNNDNNYNKIDKRRNSDQTYSRYNHNRQRRLSDQSFIKFNNYHENNKAQMKLISKNNNTKISKENIDLIRRDSETSIKSSRKDSTCQMTPKIMRRRFSEQLILEGGLRSEAEFEDLIEQDTEESFTATNARKKVTLKRHYYPEGNWGYVVLIVAIIVQLLCHGLQLGFGVLMIPTINKYHVSTVDTGNKYLKLFIFNF